MSRSPASAGFTLVEVLIALASISVLLAGAVGLLGTASLAVRSARVSTMATLLAIQKVEQLVAVPATLASGTAEDYFGGDGSTSSATSAVFTRRWTITAGWASPESASVIVEVFSSTAGRLADVQAVAGGQGGTWP